MKRAAVWMFCLATVWMLWPRSAYPHNPTTTTVLFDREISSLLERKCLQCHADGKLAMPLVTYGDARPWAEAIKEEALARRMPPWPAERGYGTFANDIGLTPREFEFLISWVDGGVPPGTGVPRPHMDHSAHWMLGDPDLMLTAQSAAVVDAGSAPAFKRLVFDTGLARETWVRAFDFKPGDARVARAAFFGVAGTTTYLGGWTPWVSSTELPPGVAFKLPPRARIAVDVLYSGTKTTVTDAPRLGIYRAASTRTATVTTSVLQPAAASVMDSSGRITAELAIDDGRRLVSLRPEMPKGGRSLELTLLRPDGSREVLLWIKDFRQEWQSPYVFQQPVELPAGSRVRATAYFDGTFGNADRPFSVSLDHYPETTGK